MGGTYDVPPIPVREAAGQQDAVGGDLQGPTDPMRGRPVGGR
jgi:hypothetical protein